MSCADFEAEMRRLRWRSRRGLLENDLVLERFFNQLSSGGMSGVQKKGLKYLLSLSDPELLNLILGCADLAIEAPGEAKAVLEILKKASPTEI